MNASPCTGWGHVKKRCEGVKKKGGVKKMKNVPFPPRPVGGEAKVPQAAMQAGMMARVGVCITTYSEILWCLFSGLEGGSMSKGSLARNCLLGLIKVLFFIAIGGAIGTVHWGLWLVSEGHTFEQGITGQVDDGMATLQGLLALGSMVGGLVGLPFAFLPWRAGIGKRSHVEACLLPRASG